VSVEGGIVGTPSNGTDFRERALDSETIGGLAPGAWRRKRSLEIPFVDTDLALRDGKRYAINLEHYEEKGIKNR
jgi:hypothetical protein